MRTHKLLQSLSHHTILRSKEIYFFHTIIVNHDLAITILTQSGNMWRKELKMLLLKQLVVIIVIFQLFEVTEATNGKSTKSTIYAL